MSEFVNFPLVILKGKTILPKMLVNFDVSSETAIKSLEEAMRQDQKIFLATQKDTNITDPKIEDLYEYGLVAEIKQLVKLQNNVVRVLVMGQVRARLVLVERTDAAELASVQLDQEQIVEAEEELVYEAMLRELKENAHKYYQMNEHVGKSVMEKTEQIEDLQSLVYDVAAHLPLDYRKRQEFLSIEFLIEQGAYVLGQLAEEMNIISIRQGIQGMLKERIDQNQKEYILREQIKVIQKELGQEEDEDSEIQDFIRQTDELQASDTIKERLHKEIKHLKKLSANSSESAVIRGYIETLLALPWDKSSKDNEDFAYAKQVLEEDHYGLEEVKDRILDFLAVRALTGRGQSPILCLVGPPGTGKTSIARSIARALNKQYERISLGGIHDEAEIRGHRKTYVGAMPGRIANALKSAQVNNPLLLLDEIDKVSRDHKGDTFSALLEVLDSEQNVAFKDHYVELAMDLSNVLFVATANSLETIPRPLLDRMEIIELSSYMETEKFHIGKEHLLEKQMEKHGLKKSQLSISDVAMKRMIRYYTKEAGVRSFERLIAKVCRKAARQIYEEDQALVRVTKNNLEDYLGKAKYKDDRKNNHDEVGIVRGLAWTSVGGVTLEVEVVIMPGKGALQLTGQLGDVMKESAQTALSYVRSIMGDYQIPPDYFQEHDIHIHVPEGAVPKDGPSAGITMTTAILSAVTKKKVRADLAMTGEVTLRGRVLPIGGLKEKLLAAKTAQISRVCIPKKNETDLSKVPEEITDGMDIILVSKVSEVLQIALVEE